MTAASGKKRLFVALGLSAVGFAIVGTLLWFYAVGSVVQTQPGDQARGLTGEFVAEYFDAPAYAGGKTTVVRTRYLDGSFDVAVDVENEAGLYVSTLYSVEQSQRDAIGVYGGLRLAAPLVGAMEDVGMQERDDLFDWGDSASSKVLLVDGEPAGHIIVARKGNVVFSCTIAGIYVDNQEELEGMLGEVLASAERDG